MHNIIKNPTFLDNHSGCTQDQIDLINTIVRTQYNRFLGKIEQKQLTDNELSQNVKSPSWRVTNLRDYNYSGVSVMTFNFTTEGMAAGNTYNVFELQKTDISSLVLYQNGLENLEKAGKYIEEMNAALFYYGRFFLELKPASNEFYIAFVAYNNEVGPDGKPGTHLPNVNWSVSLMFFAGQKDGL